MRALAQVRFCLSVLILSCKTLKIQIMLLLHRIMKKIYYLLVLLVVSAILFDGCISSDNAYTLVAPGPWRGILTLEKSNFPVTKKKDDVTLNYEQFQPGELPFNFEVVYTAPDKFYIEFINGSERVRCDSIRFGRDRTTARDTFNAYFPEYQSYIHAEVRGGGMQGYWTITTKDDYRIPFVADAGRGYRFTSLKKAPIADITGNWATLFGTDEENPEKAIGEFKQEGNYLTGTFRTETGDYRFLEGTVQDRKFWLSSFDGGHAFLFSGTIKGDTLQGEFRSGKSKPSLWTAWKDDKFQLSSPDSLSRALNTPFSLALSTPEGKEIRFPGPAFSNKIAIFTIMGTWCPNCRDEQLFLKEFITQNPALASQMVVTGCSFERHKDTKSANAQLAQYRKTLGLPFDIAYAGPASRDDAAKVFPVLDKVIAFPTMIIVDKKGKIRRVHTGFDGPATSKYADFKQNFTSLMTQLAQE